MIPQVNPRWFVSQFIWTAIFFLIQFLINKFLIFQRPLKQKIAKKMSIDLMHSQIKSIQDDISFLKNHRAEVKLIEQREKELIQNEVIADANLLFQEAIKNLDTEIEEKRGEIKLKFDLYEKESKKFSRQHKEIASLILAKLDGRTRV